LLTVAYLANRFPVPVEPYVGEEIQELRRLGVRVIAGSVRLPETVLHGSDKASSLHDFICLQPVRVLTVLRAMALIVRGWNRVADLVTRALVRGQESPQRRVKTLLHTLLGACYAVQLQEHRADHIHIHHGYFGSWIGMVAARLLEVSFSVTLHGSDLLINGAYLDTKLKNCRFAVTVSDFNRRFILQHFPAVEPGKIVVSRLGVDVPVRVEFPHERRGIRGARRRLALLAVGRLHAVKDHAFLVRASSKLRDCGLDFECLIAGAGPERQRLEVLIQKNRLQDRITLLGHVPRDQMDSLYRHADVVVLTSRSEGIPLVLMEAMAWGRIVLAPAITGIPELVIPGKTGFLYSPGDLDDFTAKVLFLQELRHAEHHQALSRLDWIRHAARLQTVHNYSRSKNLTHFSKHFLQLIPDGEFATEDWRPPHEDLILQQI